MLNLTEAEQHASRWAVAALRAILDRGRTDGRRDLIALSSQFRGLDGLSARLSADPLDLSSQRQLAQVLAVICRIVPTLPPELETALRPPPFHDLQAAQRKILEAIPRKVRA